MNYLSRLNVFMVVRDVCGFIATSLKGILQLWDLNHRPGPEWVFRTSMHGRLHTAIGARGVRFVRARVHRGDTALCRLAFVNRRAVAVGGAEADRVHRAEANSARPLVAWDVWSRRLYPEATRASCLRAAVNPDSSLATRSPASCRRVKRSNGMPLLKARITQSRYGHTRCS